LSNKISSSLPFAIDHSIIIIITYHKKSKVNKKERSAKREAPQLTLELFFPA